MYFFNKGSTKTPQEVHFSHPLYIIFPQFSHKFSFVLIVEEADSMALLDDGGEGIHLIDSSLHIHFPSSLYVATTNLSQYKILNLTIANPINPGNTLA